MGFMKRKKQPQAFREEAARQRVEKDLAKNPPPEAQSESESKPPEGSPKETGA